MEFICIHAYVLIGLFGTFYTTAKYFAMPITPIQWIKAAPSNWLRGVYFICATTAIALWWLPAIQQWNAYFNLGMYLIAGPIVRAAFKKYFKKVNAHAIDFLAINEESKDLADEQVQYGV